MSVLPPLGFVLRSLINAGGYRRYLVERGQDKDLDDIAIETKNRQSTVATRLHELEENCAQELAKECGHEWSHFFKQSWHRTREAIQVFIQQVDVSPLSQTQSHALFMEHFAVPMISGFLTLTKQLHSGPKMQQWLVQPFQTWLSLAAQRTGIPEEILLTNLGNHCNADQRTLERWLAGEPIGKIAWPYASHVNAMLDHPEKNKAPVREQEVHLLSAWLMITCAFQSLPIELREAIRHDFGLRKRQPWTLNDSLLRCNEISYRAGDSSLRADIVQHVNGVETLFAIRPIDHDDMSLRLDKLKDLIEQVPAASQSAYHYIHDWFSARNAALMGNSSTALTLYAKTVSAAWWRAGANQQPLINEALLYAVGVGDKEATNIYWDKTFQLGLNRWPKRPLDEQDLRRIAFGFEELFHPQKAKDRIPPAIGIIEADKPFTLSREQLAHPNQKTKFAEGRTRRTPLIQAVLEGTLSEVQQLIAAGADPDAFIPESGESALSYALRRAADHKDPLIMDYLLSLNLSTKTVNRPASTWRETPLKLAIEMANCAAVTRLIQLGADIEAPCDNLPSALIYAVTRLNLSLSLDAKTELEAYVSGRHRADSHDAKTGAVLDADLAAIRQQQLQLLNASKRRRHIWDELWNYRQGKPQDYRQVIQTLLNAGADANRRYQVNPQHQAEWTPTLFAAEIGDLVLFKMLVEHPGSKRGDPELTLIPASALVRHDALWIALDHQRNHIVSYLRERMNNDQIH